GDHGGAWVDETTAPAPVSSRSAERLAAERAWSALAPAGGKTVAIFPLPGIYRPGRNALRQGARGAGPARAEPGPRAQPRPPARTARRPLRPPSPAAPTASST